MKEYPEAQRVH